MAAYKIARQLDWGVLFSSNLRLILTESYQARLSVPYNTTCLCHAQAAMRKNVVIQNRKGFDQP